MLNQSFTMANMGQPVVVIQPEPQRELECFGWGDLLPSTTITTSTTTSSPNIVPMQVSSTTVASSPWHLVEEMDSSSSTDEESSDEEEEDTSSSAMETDEEECTTTSLSSYDSWTKQNEERRSIRFGPVQVREYAVTLGDHPLADEYPLSLDWQHGPSIRYDLDDFEHHYRRTSTCFLRGARNAGRQPQRLSPVDRRLRLAAVKGESMLHLCQQEAERRRMLVGPGRLIPSPSVPSWQPLTLS
mmetsp:Transcript_29105/g.79893  ORF Transcript_29105/g.79893 Transcript_29105/m.79893 type:complete len:243 (-) Transcript_29105:42-770(-)